MSKYYDSETNSFLPIPDSPYYVLSNDSFLSDCGICKGKINVCIVPCKDHEECNRVMKYIKSRSDQKYIRMVIHKPKTRKNVIYSLVLGWLEIAKRS